MKASLLTVLPFFVAISTGLSPPAPARHPVEQVIVHIPLAFNDGTPVSRAELRGLLGELSVLGGPAEHPGHGTFVDSRNHVSVEPVDHVVVLTSSPSAERVVISVLQRMRRDLRQESTLAEVAPDPRNWHNEEARVQFDAVISAQGSGCDRRCTALRRLLDDAGGGDSEFDDGNRAHLMSSVPHQAASQLRAALRAMRVSFTERPAAFVLVTS